MIDGMSILPPHSTRAYIPPILIWFISSNQTSKFIIYTNMINYIIASKTMSFSFPLPSSTFFLLFLPLLIHPSFFFATKFSQPLTPHHFNLFLCCHVLVSARRMDLPDFSIEPIFPSLIIKQFLTFWVKEQQFFIWIDGMSILPPHSPRAKYHSNSHPRHLAYQFKSGF